MATEETLAPVGSAAAGGGSLWGLSWLHFLNDGAANFLPGILPLLLVSMHRSAALAGTLMAALLIGQGLQPLFGYWADRVGGRGLVGMGFLGTAGGMAAIGMTTHFAPLLLALVIIGVANSAFHPQALAAARSLEQAHHRKGAAVSVFLVGGELGRGLSPWLATLVVVGLGLAHLWILALVSLASLVTIYPTVPSLPARPYHAAPLTFRGKVGPLTALIGFAGLRAFVTYAVVTLFPFVWHARGGSVITGALLIAVIIVAGIIGNLSGPLLARRFGRPHLLTGAMLLSAILLALAIVLPWDIDWFVLALFGMALFVPMAVTVVIGQDLFPENRSLGAGLALGSANGLGALAMLGLGQCVRVWGLPVALWTVVGAALLAAVVARFAVAADDPLPAVPARPG